MFLRKKIRKVARKISQGAPFREIQTSVVDVLKEGRRQLVRKANRFDRRMIGIR